MKLRYLAVMTPEPEGGYSVSFPDCKGCHTEGDTLNEAIDMAADALEGWIEGMREEGLAIANPSEPEKIAARLKAGDILVPILAPPPPAKAVPITITVREDLLQVIDQRAREAGLSRSAFISQSAAGSATISAQDIGAKLDALFGAGNIPKPGARNALSKRFELYEKWLRGQAAQREVKQAMSSRAAGGKAGKAK